MEEKEEMKYTRVDQERPEKGHSTERNLWPKQVTGRNVGPCGRSWVGEHLEEEELTTLNRVRINVGTEIREHVELANEHTKREQKEVDERAC